MASLAASLLSPRLTPRPLARVIEVAVELHFQVIQVHLRQSIPKHPVNAFHQELVRLKDILRENTNSSAYVRTDLGRDVHQRANHLSEALAIPAHSSS